MALEQLTLHIIYIYTYVYILHTFIVVLLHKQQILPVESAIACSELSLENDGNLFIYIYIINNSMIAGHEYHHVYHNNLSNMAMETDPTKWFHPYTSTMISTNICGMGLNDIIFHHGFS